MNSPQFISCSLLLQILYCIGNIASDTTVQSVGNYDFIVVGAGSAGSTVASRLSEDENISVLLLEAGPRPSKASEVPLNIGLNVWGSELSWNYTVEPSQYSCLKQLDGRCLFYAGHALGGGSSVNFMLYTRGSKADFDLWEEMGATGWNYEAVLPYFKKAEGVQIDPQHIEIDYHGTNGNLTVSEPNYHTEMREDFLQATREAGCPTLDYNGHQQGGFATTQATIRDGYRCSTVKAYLDPASGRNNLEIITEALVTKIDIDETKTAKGVYYLKDGQTFYAKADKEVIVSAGTINTPQILLLSGIGPKTHLEKMKIELVEDLPVGLNLHDHVAVLGLIYKMESSNGVSMAQLREEFQASTSSNPDTAVLKGPMSTPGLIEVFGYYKTRHETLPGDYNDMQYFFSPVNNLMDLMALEKDVRDFFEQFRDVPCFSIIPANLHVKSRGTITLQSNNPRDPPVIQPNYLKEPIDLKVLAAGMIKAHEFTQMPAFEKYKPELIGPVPGCEEFELASEEYFGCISRLLTSSFAHSAGTSKMGQPNDPTTVVDPDLKVKGINGLRVMDASVMPIVVSANTNAAAIMIGEKGADIIKKEYGS